MTLLDLGYSRPRRGVVPVAVAAALTRKLVPSGPLVACFDGERRALPTPPPLHQQDPSAWLKALLHQDRAHHARAAVSGVVPATPAEVAAFVRAWDPDGWRRHQVFLDELALWKDLPSTQALLASLSAP